LFSYFQDVSYAQQATKGLVGDIYRKGFLGGAQTLIEKWRPGNRFVPEQEILDATESTRKTNLTPEQLVKNVGLPESVIRSGLGGLVKKIK
jgi:hypothetical protein